MSVSILLAIKSGAKATTETFIFPEEFFKNIGKTHMKNGLVNS